MTPPRSLPNCCSVVPVMLCTWIWFMPRVEAIGPSEFSVCEAVRISFRAATWKVLLYLYYRAPISPRAALSNWRYSGVQADTFSRRACSATSTGLSPYLIQIVRDARSTSEQMHCEYVFFPLVPSVFLNHFQTTRPFSIGSMN